MVSKVSMVFVLLVAVVAVLLIENVSGQGTSCGPSQCYFPCGESAQQAVDFVFLVDISSSLDTTIAGLNTGMSSSSCPCSCSSSSSSPAEILSLA